MAKSKQSVGDRLGSLGAGVLVGGVPAAYIIGKVVSAIKKSRAVRDYEEAKGHSHVTRRSDLNIPRFAYNRVDGKLTSVFDDEEKALDALHPEWRKKNAIRRFLLKAKIRGMINNPQFSQKYNSVFVPRHVDGRVLAHELGHAADNREKPLNGWERMFFHPHAIVPFITDPENTPLMLQERKAWDIGKVPEDDELRTAALNTYREAQESIRRPYRYGLGAAVVGALLMGAGVVSRQVSKD